MLVIATEMKTRFSRLCKKGGVMKSIVPGICIVLGASICPSAAATPIECHRVGLCDAIVNQTIDRDLVVAWSFRIPRPTPRYTPHTPPLRDFETFPKSRDYGFGGPEIPKSSPKVDGPMGTELPPWQTDISRQLKELEQLQKIKPVDPLAAAAEAQSARNEALQSASKESKTFVVERLDSPFGGESTPQCAI